MESPVVLYTHIDPTSRFMPWSSRCWLWGNDGLTLSCRPTAGLGLVHRGADFCWRMVLHLPGLICTPARSFAIRKDVWADTLLPLLDLSDHILNAHEIIWRITENEPSKHFLAHFYLTLLIFLWIMTWCCLFICILRYCIKGSRTNLLGQWRERVGQASLGLRQTAWIRRPWATISRNTSKKL